MLDTIKTWARLLERGIFALYLAGRDSRVPWHAKVVAAATAAYALSPIDLIPDVIPVIGYLDDLLIVPLGILLATRLIPTPLMDELRAEATVRLDARPPRSLLGGLAVIGVWLLAGCLAAQALLPLR
jgi:uncharacterized membrane protein YkvA (DUF1232 family)